MNFGPKTLLSLGAATIAFAPILVKAIQLDSAEIALYRCSFATILLFPLIWKEIRPVLLNGVPLLKWLIGAGVFFAFDLYAWHFAVKDAGAGMGTILANTQVFYLSGFGILFLKEAITKRFVFSVLLGFFGVYLLVQFGQSDLQGPHYYRGIGLGLLTGLLYSSYLLCLRRAEGLFQSSSPSVKVFFVCAVATIVLLPLQWLHGTLHFPLGMDLLLMFLLAAGPQVLGWYLITKALPLLPISSSALILLGQPALATLLGAFIFHEMLSPTQIIGALLTLSAIYLGSLR